MHKHNNAVWHNGYITKADRNRPNKHKKVVIWYTKLSASGKYTSAYQKEKYLFKERRCVSVFHEDNITHRLNTQIRGAAIRTIRKIHGEW